MTKAYCAVMNKESMCFKEERKCDKPSLNLVANVMPVNSTKSSLRSWWFCSSLRASLRDFDAYLRVRQTKSPATQATENPQ